MTTDPYRRVAQLVNAIKPTAAALPTCALTSLMDVISTDPDRAVSLAAYAILALALPAQTPALRDNAGLIWYPAGQPDEPVYTLGEHHGCLTRHEIDTFHGPLTELPAADDQKTERLPAHTTATNLTAPNHPGGKPRTLRAQPTHTHPQPHTINPCTEA